MPKARVVSPECNINISTLSHVQSFYVFIRLLDGDARKVSQVNEFWPSLSLRLTGNATALLTEPPGDAGLLATVSDPFI